MQTHSVAPLRQRLKGTRELIFSFIYLVAMEKWLSVWHDAGGTDNEVTAKRLAIGQLDVHWPGSY